MGIRFSLAYRTYREIGTQNCVQRSIHQIVKPTPYSRNFAYLTIVYVARNWLFMVKRAKKQQVYTLLVEIGRKEGDGLPKNATGAALMCFASGVDEAEAVRETVAILKQADTAPLDVTGYGTLAEREAQGHEIDGEERALMQRALDENAVIVAQVSPFFGDDK